jgi:hypothetical protein
MSSEKGMTMPKVDIPDIIYAVYDSDIVENEPGREVPFIEQRRELSESFQQKGADEIYFRTLSEAKVFVKKNFVYGAKYFSSKQLDSPDNLIYVLTDKLVYLMA